jgi:hypothetical protein
MRDAAIPSVAAQRDRSAESQDVMTKRTRARSAGGTGALLRRVVLGAFALVGLVLLASACSGGSGGSGVAQSGAGGTNSPSPSPSSGGSALAYSRCMRDHGVSDFPDPNSNGEINDPKLEEPSDVVAKAQDACEDLAPEGEPADSGKQAAATEKVLAYSQCMRDHGISGFPDPVPDPGGGWIIPKNGAYDPRDPAVKQADQACLESVYANTSPTESPGN